MKQIDTLSTRERSKLERRGRIKKAASEVFGEKGYQGATTQEIATRAGVAIGTLFSYAPEKTDLLLMVVNDDLDVLDSQTFASLRGDKLIDQLMFVFKARYKYYGANPALSRQILHVRVLARASVEVGRLEFRRNALISGLAKIVRMQQERGSVREGDATAFAHLFHSIFTAELRDWLSSASPDLEKGLSSLREMIEIAIDGVALTVSSA